MACRLPTPLIRTLRVALCSTLLVACAEANAPDNNSQTHWLRECSGDADCGDLSCVCGVCSTGCSSDASCEAELGAGAVCGTAQAVDPAQVCANGAQRICVATCVDDVVCAALDSELSCHAGLCARSVVDPDVGVGATATPDGGASDAQVVRGARDGSMVVAADATTPANDAGPDAGDGDPPVEDAGEDAGAPIEVVSVCDDGVPPLPLGVEVFASNVNSFWSVSNGLVSWIAEDPSGTWSVMRQPVSGGSATEDEPDVDDPTTLVIAYGANGSDVVLGLFNFPFVSNDVTVRVMSDDGSWVNVAVQSGGAGWDTMLLESDDVFWLNNSGSVLTLFRSPRVPGTSTALGTVSSPISAVGPLAMGSDVYVGANFGPFTSPTGRLYRAPRNGSTALAAVGDELPYIVAFKAFAGELFVLLQRERDPLGNPIAPGRVARVLGDGSVQTVAEVVGDAESLAIGADRAFWYQADGVWSAPLDGLTAPTHIVEQLGDYPSGELFVDASQVYIRVSCAVPGRDPGTTSSSSYIVRTAF